jgi:redox-sensitive bicupin YhaK (pirin superfamily)
VGGLPVIRLLPKRRHRTVGAWCFADHFGPADVVASPMRVGPHPHIGLQTVTWLVAGEVLHRDSLGSEQAILPGQLNLMTAGAGVAHTEETPERSAGMIHGIQLWVAQPEGVRSGGPAFEHHPALPQVEAGGVTGSVLVGEWAGARSPARVDSPLLGVELVVRTGADLPLEATYEHAVIVLDGMVDLGGTALAPGRGAYLAPGRDEVRLAAGQEAARVLLLGGEPFPETVLMWWNFVARTTDEIEDAYHRWEARDGRYGEVPSHLERMTAPRPQWLPLP